MREQAERIAARIPNINLRANKIAESIWTGLHSRKKGWTWRVILAIQKI